MPTGVSPGNRSACRALLSRLKLANSVVLPFHSIRIVPRCPSNSMMHVGATAVCRISSTMPVSRVSFAQSVCPKPRFA
jgi:hypothetical protein